MAKLSPRFIAVQKRVLLMDGDDRAYLAVTASRELVKMLGRCTNDPNVVFGTLAAAAKIGMTEGKDKKSLCERVFSLYLKNGAAERLYSYISAAASESDWNNIGNVVRCVKGTALPMAQFILCFAVNGDTMDDNFACRVDRLCTPYFPDDEYAYAYDMPPEPVQLNGTQKLLYDYLCAEDEQTLEMLEDAFPQISREELTASLDALCEKGVCYRINSVAGAVYTADN